jgi:hypothetical protein
MKKALFTILVTLSFCTSFAQEHNQLTPGGPANSPLPPEPEIIMPVSYLFFTASPFENKVEVKWETVMEENASHFLLFKSKEGTDWTLLDSVDCKGENYKGATYQAFDVSPSNVNYYMLQQIDKDGTINKGPLCFTTFIPSEMPYVLIYPNPTNATAGWQLTSLAPFQYWIFDMKGQLLTASSQTNTIAHILPPSHGVFKLVVNIASSTQAFTLVSTP